MRANGRASNHLAVRKAAPSPAPTGHVYGYARVSTVQQADEGESVEVQRRSIAGYAQMHGLAVARVFVERDVSGSKPLGDRPQGVALLAALEPGHVVITPKLDRRFRSALDVLGKLKKAGVSLHMIDLGGDTTGNGVSKLVFTILSAVAEAERDRTRERITEVKRDQRQHGRYLGGAVPWGYRVGEAGELVPIPEQQAALKRMQKLRDQGLALRTTADRMNAAGVSFSHVSVKNALVAAARGAA
jgi:DNA invertase Pin-like site-specific DNA recombinase